MHVTLEGNMAAGDARIAIVVCRFNEFITTQLLQGALDALRRQGLPEENVTVAWCPGAFEAPLVVQKLAQSGSYDAVVALGAVIRGATPHFDLVAGQSASGISNVALETGIPILNGIITTETIEQAIERAGTKAGNKGAEAALGAIEMINLLRQI